MVEISQSRINTWRKCRRAHYYKYVMNLERKKPPVPLVRGKILHAIIEAWINGHDWKMVMEEQLKPFYKLFAEEREEYGDLPTEIPRLMAGYVKTYAEDGLEYLDIKGRRNEFEIKLELIPDKVTLIGYIDTVARDKNGRIWMVEHKTHKNFPKESYRLSNFQAVVYCYAMPQIGLPKPDGVMWDYLRTKPPTKPEVLKDGGLSKRKNIDTTYDTYLETILEHDLNPNDYREILDMLKSQGNDSFYQRIFYPAPESIMADIIRDLRETSLEIYNLGEISKSRNLTKDCSWCSYYSICQAELRNLDTEFLLKAEYQNRRSDRDEKEREEQSE